MVYFLRFLAFFFGILFRPFRRRWKTGEPIRCLLVGYSGANNTGAEVHAAEAIKQMREATDGKLDVTVTSLDRRRSLRYLTEDERLHVVEIPSAFMIALLKLVLRADVVVLVEGYCFMEYFSQVLFWLFMFSADLAQRLGLVTVAYAVDAGALRPANASWARRVADRLDLLMMRTNATAKVLEGMGALKKPIVTTDTAFTIEPASHAWVEKKLVEVGLDRHRPTIGIAFEEFFWWPVVPRLGKFLLGIARDRYKSIYYHRWTSEGRGRSRAMKETVAAFADWAGREFDAHIALFAMERVNAEPCGDVIRMMERPAALFDADRYDGRELTALLRELKFLVTNEYHALLLSMGGGVPVIGLGHDERIQSVLAELGFKNEYYVHYDERDILGKLKRKSALLVAEEGIVRKQIADAYPSYLERMRANGTHFAKLVATKFQQ